MSKQSDRYEKLFDAQNTSNSKKEKEQKNEKELKKVDDNRKVLFNQKNSHSVENFVRKLYKSQEKQPLIPKENENN